MGDNIDVAGVVNKTWVWVERRDKKSKKCNLIFAIYSFDRIAKLHIFGFWWKKEEKLFTFCKPSLKFNKFYALKLAEYSFKTTLQELATYNLPLKLDS